VTRNPIDERSDHDFIAEDFAPFFEYNSRATSASVRSRSSLWSNSARSSLPYIASSAIADGTASLPRLKTSSAISATASLPTVECTA